MDQKMVGMFLKELRKEKNITQEQLAERLNVSSRTVSRWETGNNMPDISLLVEIAEIYDVSIPEIINGERKSEIMNEEVKVVAEKMADYAGVEKGKIIKDIQKQSILGVCAAAGVMLVELFGTESSVILDKVHMYLETLVYVSVIMIFFFSTGLLYKANKKNKLNKLPKPVMMVVGAVVAFVAAFLVKFVLSSFGL